MPFEPQFPEKWSNLFHGHIETQITDPHGIPANTIISLTDDWHLKVDWQVHGMFVPMMCGTWHVKVFLESIGPGPEIEAASADFVMTGDSDYSHTFFIGPRKPEKPGPYKLVTIITATNRKGHPSPLAGYDEGPILQFYAGESLPPSGP
jgi:hypothetical protein